MAQPQASLIKSVAIQKFQSFQLRLPSVASSSSSVASPLKGSSVYTPVSGRSFGGGGHRVTPPTGSTGSPMSCPPSLFVAALNDTRDCDQQKLMSDKFEAYIRYASEAIALAWYKRQQESLLTGVNIVGRIASGGVIAPRSHLNGCLGIAFADNTDAWRKPRNDAIRTALGKAFDDYFGALTVPGLPWYPTFEAVRMPVAPPTPNSPSPLISLSGNVEGLRPQILGPAISAAFGPVQEFSDKLFAALAEGFWSAFDIWRTQTLVRNVMGSGPVPGYAPPMIPQGRVIGGVGNMIPGGFA
jgi:hypothetical protein